ncbi:carbon-nitrogen hydrolase family protein [Pseudoteredinibacter isoporae]|uniref:Putative amidohydrolase n=1 Tax=Pseudoteredinibacter isoporae TaxID=570281 RepID=A0A7X0JXL9_9GAMM|nr:carbon-nitrogen hydrolase family protein [Pseudoteredinibacter isoporae]MBB6523589.1 putative amidohydrolase [Pseudoteredinibacter isoporae]NHO89097.1 carbon-nitrogen hydrolase family protein [Pseudoteredinibacter isoporae]NIB22292.1 carbon-nitrogen hydrolase family protein [Pseudoteredinibacter isoporae]
MNICVAQLQSIAGDLEVNLQKHLDLIALAAREKVDLICFPELSLSAYEPTLAAELAFDADKVNIPSIQEQSDQHGMLICLGMPVRFRNELGEAEVRISMLCFQPFNPVRVYSKQLLHSSELPFFAPGHCPLFLEYGNERIAPAICYESKQCSHNDAAIAAGASLYMASVAKDESSLAAVTSGLYSTLAKRSGMKIMMANNHGPNHDFIGHGQSAIWDAQGNCVAQLGVAGDGIVVFDTITGKGFTKTL